MGAAKLIGEFYSGLAECFRLINFFAAGVYERVLLIAIGAATPHNNAPWWDCSQIFRELATRFAVDTNLIASAASIGQARGPTPVTVEVLVVGDRVARNVVKFFEREMVGVCGYISAFLLSRSSVLYNSLMR